MEIKANRGKVTGLWTVTRNGPDILPSSQIWLRDIHIWTCRPRRRLSEAQKRGRTTHETPRGDGGGRGRAARREPRSGASLCC